MCVPAGRYIVEVVRPAPAAVLSALRLLTRCCRHSLQLAAEVASCPRLIDALIAEFLPVCGAAPLGEGRQGTRLGGTGLLNGEWRLVLADVPGVPKKYQIQIGSTRKMYARHAIF